jgi:hypothetical protein
LSVISKAINISVAGFTVGTTAHAPRYLRNSLTLSLDFVSDRIQAAEAALAQLTQPSRTTNFVGCSEAPVARQLIEELAPYVLGWRGYFGFCQTPRVLTNLEAWIRRRLRSYLWRQWQNGHTRFNELRRRGVPKFHAAVAAGSPTGFWRMSGHPAVQQALRNHYFDSLGLPRLHVPEQA